LTLGLLPSKAQSDVPIFPLLLHIIKAINHQAYFDWKIFLACSTSGGILRYHFVEHGSNLFSFLHAGDLDDVLAFLKKLVESCPEETDQRSFDIWTLQKKTQLSPIDKNYQSPIRPVAAWDFSRMNFISVDFPDPALPSPSNEIQIFSQKDTLFKGRPRRDLQDRHHRIRT
jgi:hypothetical protein